MVHIELKADCSYLRKAYYYIFTKKCNNMSNLHNTYTKILSLLHELEPRVNLVTVNLLVPGSSPGRGAKFKKSLQVFAGFFMSEFFIYTKLVFYKFNFSLKLYVLGFTPITYVTIPNIKL